MIFLKGFNFTAADIWILRLNIKSAITFNFDAKDNFFLNWINFIY